LQVTLQYKFNQRMKKLVSKHIIDIHWTEWPRKWGYIRSGMNKKLDTDMDKMRLNSKATF